MKDTRERERERVAILLENQEIIYKFLGFLIIFRFSLAEKVSMESRCRLFVAEFYLKKDMMIYVYFRDYIIRQH